MNPDLAKTLLAWFDREARALPWREKDGIHRRRPYAVLVSELMLQQTQVSTVIPYYERFMARFPEMEDLASADELEVLKYWEGLGYYRRARHLWTLARKVATDLGGRLPADRKTLMSLPGIGPYTAGAILAFAYDLPEPAVDGNVVRVLARLDALPHVQGHPGSLRAVRERVAQLIPSRRAGDFGEALMELGATICLPTSPRCASCPLSSFCLAFSRSEPEAYPVKRKDLEKPVSHLTYVLVHDGSSVFCRRRPEGLLAGLFEFHALEGKLMEEDRVRRALEGQGKGPPVSLRFAGESRALFSHRSWEMAFWEAEWLTCESLLVKEGGFFGRDDLLAFEIGDLRTLPFPAFLTAWRDDFIRRQEQKTKNPGSI